MTDKAERKNEERRGDGKSLLWTFRYTQVTCVARVSFDVPGSVNRFRTMSDRSNESDRLVVVNEG